MLYRVGRYDECSGIYGRLMDEGAVNERRDIECRCGQSSSFLMRATQGDDVDLKTNTYAAFTLAGRAHDVMQDYPADEGEMEEGFELRYNLARALISVGDLQAAETQLRTAFGTTNRRLSWVASWVASCVSVPDSIACFLLF